MSTLILTRIFIAAAAVFGGWSVAGGAFASHALKNQLSDRALAIFETGARYQMYHALALLLVALLLSRAPESQTFFAVAGWAFVTGTIIFSGSLYALSLTDIKWLGAITPLGGVALIIAVLKKVRIALCPMPFAYLIFLRKAISVGYVWHLQLLASNR